MKSRMASRLWLVFFCVFWALSVIPAQAQSSAPQAVVLTFRGPITPVLVEYLERGLSAAKEQNASVVVLQLDTPGGAIDTMERIVQTIRSSPVPVAVYVSPRNAAASSAGALITMAGHISAMAPETTIGAASPVGGQGEDIEETMQAKVKESLKASVRALTANRPPEATRLAEDMIDSAKAVTVEEALAIGLVDYKAFDVQDLLDQMDGRTVELDSGSVTLATAGAQLVEIRASLIENVLQLLINPNLVFLLLSTGIWALMIELSSPGGWVAGFIGVVCILLAVYGLGILPVNWFGILFIGVAFVLFVLEVKTPTVGMLSAAGAISLIAGALILFNSVRIPGLPRISPVLVVVTSIVLAGSFLAIVTFALRAQTKPVLTGREALPRQVGVVRTALHPTGTVQVAGELWAAEVEEGQPHAAEGDRVEVLSVNGLRLIVRKVNPPS